MHIGQSSCENRLVLIYSDNQKNEVEVECHPFSGIQDLKEWVLKKQFLY